MESKKRPWWQSLEERDSRPERRQGLSQSLFFSLNSRSCPNWQQILHGNLVTSNKFLQRSHISTNWLLCVWREVIIYGMQRCSSEVLIITILAKRSFSWAAGKFDKGLKLRFKIVRNFQFPSAIFSCHLKMIKISSHGYSITPVSQNVIWFCNRSLLSK